MIKRVFSTNVGIKFSAMALGAALGIIFFFVYSYLPLAVPLYYNSPDENANAVFAQLMAESGQLHRLDPLNLMLDDLVHPRSVRVVEGLQVPGGFLGLPVLFGGLAKAFGTEAIPFMMPFFSLLGVLAWGALVRRLFGTATGILAGVLLATSPVWWYWSSRTLMPNVLFVSLLIIAAYFLFCAPVMTGLSKRSVGGLQLLRRLDGAVAGMFCGLAFMVRPDGVYWLAIIALALVIMRRGRLPWGRVAIFVVFTAMTLVPCLIMNQSLYGHYIATGYGDVVATVDDGAHGGFGARLLGPLRPVLFPLGFAPRVALANFWSFGLKLFWWWWLPVVAAVLFLIRERRRAPCPRERSRRVTELVVVGLAVSVWLIMFYGSWRVQDNPDPNAVTVGASYTRHWLPMFVFATLPLAAGLARVIEVWRKRKAAVALVAAVCLVITVVSGLTVFGAPQEGLSAVRGTLVGYRREAEAVLALTEPGAIVVVDRADKYLFPKRAVIYPLRAESTYGILPRALVNRPTYYYGLTLPESDLAWLRTVKLAPSGLTIDLVADLGENSLYVFRPLDTEVENSYGNASSETP